MTEKKTRTKIKNRKGRMKGQKCEKVKKKKKEKRNKEERQREVEREKEKGTLIQGKETKTIAKYSSLIIQNFLRLSAGLSKL